MGTAERGDPGAMETTPNQTPAARLAERDDGPQSPQDAQAAFLAMTAEQRERNDRLRRQTMAALRGSEL